MEINSRQDARSCGISVIYQELSLIPALTVTENIFLGQENCKFGYLNKKQMRERVKYLIDHYGFALNPDAIVKSLGMAQRQMTEILKALAFKAQVSSLWTSRQLPSRLQKPKNCSTPLTPFVQKGASIIYISHRLEEVYTRSATG